MKPTFIRELFARHFSSQALERLAVLCARYPLWMRPDVIRAIGHVLDSHAVFHGVRLRNSSAEFRLNDLMEGGRTGAVAGPPAYDDVDVGDAEPLRCPQRGLWLARDGGAPVAVLIETDDGYRHGRVRLEIAAANEADAADVLHRIRALAAHAETFRGKVLAPAREEAEFGESATTLRLARLSPVAREQIVLAPGVLELVERSTLGFAAHCDALVGFGMSAQKGLLLYGPPGTGKTMLVRYLAGALPAYTKLLLAGDRMGWLAETVEAARRLSPAMVVIEDVDLVAADREGPWQQSPATLNRMLNEMDGAGPDARVLFVLTTNRPEVLEPALAARPGRVDQSIEISLPEDRERRLLLRRYAGGLQPGEELIAQVSRRIGKVSPAFIKELCRRAAQMMLERAGARLEPEDFETAFEDMLTRGGSIATRLLGAERFGFTATPA